MSTYELPDAMDLSDLAHDFEFGTRKGAGPELLKWILEAKAELDRYREIDEGGFCHCGRPLELMMQAECDRCVEGEK